MNLELGSVDPFIVFKDADLDVAVPGVAWARLLNAGQVCTSSKRIYVGEPIAGEFTQRLEAYVRTLGVGDPMEPDTDVGPLISAEALETVEAQVARRSQEGAGCCWRLPRRSRQGLRAISSSRRSSRTCGTARCRRPRRSSVPCCRSPSRRRGRSDRHGQRQPLRARRVDLHQRPARRRCGRWRRSRRAPSGSTIRSPTTTRGRSAGCARAGSGGSWARRGSTPFASRSTCTSTT